MRAAALPGIEDAVERDPLDFNRTPAWPVQLLVPHLGAPRTVIDVGCGDGAIGRALRQAWRHADISGVEIHGERWRAARRATNEPHWSVYRHVWHADWCEPLRNDWPSDAYTADLIISNPPFGLAALPFLQRAVERVASGGTVAFLLPVHWVNDPDVESDYARQRWLDSLRLADGREGYCRLDIVGGGPYPARPSFKKKGTASDRYAWFLFGERWAGRPGFRLHAIPPEEPTAQLDLLGGG